MASSQALKARLICLPALAMLFYCVTGVSPAAAVPNLLFEDSFDNGAMSTDWSEKAPSHWIEDGWLHAKDTDGWPRDSLIITHDRDASWRDYRVRLFVDFVEGTEWEHATIVLRADNFVNTSAGSSGRGYLLIFRGSKGWFPEDQQTIYLYRADNDLGISTPLFRQHWNVPTSPFFVDVSLNGNRISLAVDEQSVLDVTDPAPLLFGGVGLHTVWESEARFDSVYITSIIPEPHSNWMMSIGLVAVLMISRLRR